MAVLGLILVLLVILVSLGVLATFIDVVGKKCSACGTRNTFTWVSVASEASSEEENIQVHTNRYCFHCCDFTAHDDRARQYLESCRSYRLALYHHRIHQRKQERKATLPA